MIQRSGYLKFKAIGRKTIEYLLFWSLSLWLTANFFAYGDHAESIDWIYTTLFHISIWFALIINSFLLIPHLLASGRWAFYLFAVLILLAISVYLNLFTFNVFTDLIFPNFYFISYYEWYDIAYFLFAYLILTSLIQFSRSWFTESETRRKLAEIDQLRAKQELQLLRGQIEPHFLFNSLNTIYGLVKKKSDEAADTVLKLSDLLRYAIQQSSREEVPLNDEIDYLSDYIHFQQKRLNNPQNIRFETIGGSHKLTIIPMLLIIFVENLFKYGDMDQPAEITLQIQDNRLSFRTQNVILTGEDSFFKRSMSNGTGLKNAQKRLELHYRNEHTLQIQNEGDIYEVNLDILLKNVDSI